MEYDEHKNNHVVQRISKVCEGIHKLVCIRVVCLFDLMLYYNCFT